MEETNNLIQHLDDKWSAMENHVSAVEQQLVDLHDEVHKISCLEKEVFRLKQHTEDLESSRNWRNNL